MTGDEYDNMTRQQEDVLVEACVKHLEGMRYLEGYTTKALEKIALSAIYALHEWITPPTPVDLVKDQKQ